MQLTDNGPLSFISHQNTGPQKRAINVLYGAFVKDLSLQAKVMEVV